jgi:uncharacterized protein (TIGR02266 family)
MFLKKVKPAGAVDELSRLDAAATQREAAAAAEVEKLKARAAAVAEQLAQTRASMGEVEKLGVEDASMHLRLDRLELPRPDASAMALEVEHAKRAALAVREGAADQLEQEISEWKQALDQASKQLDQDQASIRKAYEAARQARVRAVEPPAETMITARPKARPGPEGRTAPRVAMQAQIDFGSDSNFYSGFSTNISDGGVFIATVNVLPLGTEVDLSFTLPNGKSVRSKGVVRWVREVNDKIPDAFPGIGVQFESLPESAHDAIHGFVAEREPLFFPE